MFSQLLSNRGSGAYLITTLVTILIANASHAGECNYTNAVVSAGNPQIEKISRIEDCNPLPNAAVMQHLLIDDKFTNISIKNEGNMGGLLKYATKRFGNMDSKAKSGKNINAAWKKSKDHKIIYTSSIDNGKPIENLAITCNNAVGCAIF